MIAESVNPLAITRDAWREVGVRAGVPVAEVEVVCTDLAEHRHRVTSRPTDIPDLRLPDWQEVTDREYDPWEHERIVVDTSGQTPDASLGAPFRRLGRS
ncbi:hypothetical protein [Nonomuraea sp. B19D2]|uniref:hypothetical protein n=1 Tax=Nonomuraea sp. B19D2 TaxID=3159561 RepID=UPI0032DA25CF